MIPGIITGLLAALGQSLVYLSTRHYVQRRPAGASRELLVLAHAWMGIFSLIVLPFVWPAGGGAILWGVARPLLTCCCFYLIAQMWLFLALKHAEPSRVSPLLGFKIVVLAVLASFFVLPHRPGAPAPPVGLTWLQWMGVGLCLVSAVGLNFSGVRLRRRALIAIALACVCYSMSDWNITLVVMKAEGSMSQAAAAVLTTCLCYGVCGVIAACLLPVMGTRDPGAWRGSVPFAVFWFSAMLCLFACFGILGPVLGGILQSSRGLISIVLGSLVMRRGHFHMEPSHSRGVFWRRMAAGALMFLAVSLYVIRDPHTFTIHAGGGDHEVSHGATGQPAR
jgi:hypothetical protein